jgi:hypothetical protein
MEPNTTIKMMGNSSEKTMEVGLLRVASKLYREMEKAAFTWLAGLLIWANIKYYQSICERSLKPFFVFICITKQHSMFFDKIPLR